MEINKPQLNNKNFSLGTSIDEHLIEEIEVDLASKPNVFSSYNAKVQASEVPIEKPKNPIKRLNTMDNEFLLQEDVNTPNLKAETKTSQKDARQVWNAFKAVFKGVVSKVPVVNSFILIEKQSKLKTTIKDLSSINNNVNELISMSFPAEENFDKYKIISENLIKANTIHSKIIKEIQD